MHITSYLIRLRQSVCLFIGVARNYIVMFDLWVDLFVNSVDLLGVSLYADLKVNHIRLCASRTYHAPPPPPKRSRVGSFFSHGYLVLPKFFPQRKSAFCRRY